jgi:hypothetical protein
LNDASLRPDRILFAESHFDREFDGWQQARSPGTTVDFRSILMVGSGLPGFSF